MKLSIHKSYGGFGEYIIQAPGATLEQMQKLLTDLENVDKLRSKLESVRNECETLRKVRDEYKAKLPKVSPPPPPTFEQMLERNDKMIELLCLVRERNKELSRYKAAIERVRKECDLMIVANSSGLETEAGRSVIAAISHIRSAIGDVGEQPDDGKVSVRVLPGSVVYEPTGEIRKPLAGDFVMYGDAVIQSTGSNWLGSFPIVRRIDVPAQQTQEKA